MKPWEREIIRQAAILRAIPDPTGRANEVRTLPCQFQIKDRCKGPASHLEYDPTGEAKLPAPSCESCHNYIDRCFEKSIKSEEGNMRIKLAILATHELLMAKCKQL